MEGLAFYQFTITMNNESKKHWNMFRIFTEICLKYLSPMALFNDIFGHKDIVTAKIHTRLVK